MAERSRPQKHTTLLIPAEDLERLEQLAQELGYLQTRGAGAGKLGSISALVCAIARGEIEVVEAQQKDREDA